MILQSDNPIRMVRELKGAPLSILMILRLVHQPVSSEYLETATGYTDKPIRKALRYLQEIGMALQSARGWILASGEKQLPMVMQLNEQALPEDDTDSDTTPPEENNQTEIIQKCRNNSDSVNYLINNINNLSSNQVNKVINGESRKNSDLEDCIHENLETFREMGIGLNRRTEALARMKHVSRDYIQHMVNNLKQGETLGMAIIRMEKGEGIAASQRHRDGCQCDECRRRFIEGWESIGANNWLSDEEEGE